MIGRITKRDGWMNYSLHIDGESRPRRIYWRNHNRSYVKRNGAWQEVYFNQYILDLGPYNEIPMKLDDENHWVMVHEYEQTPGGASAQYSIIAE